MEFLQVIGKYWYVFLILAFLLWFTLRYSKAKAMMAKEKEKVQERTTKIALGTKVILDSGMHGIVRGITEKTYVIEIAPKVLVEFEKYGVIFVDSTTGETQ